MQGTEEGRGQLRESRLRLRFSGSSKARVSGIGPRPPDWVSMRSVFLCVSLSLPAWFFRLPWPLSEAGGVPNTSDFINVMEPDAHHRKVGDLRFALIPDEMLYFLSQKCVWFVEECCWYFDGDCIECVVCFRQDGHFDYTNSS